MISFRILTIAALTLAASALSGCGFKPLYATDNAATRPVLANVRLGEVYAAETIEPQLMRAFVARTVRDGDTALYDLDVVTREGARALAVRIDASATRYNYELTADYTLTRRSDGMKIKGRAKSLASFNVVESQYSTLFAEEAAREKASRTLVDEIERSILLKLEEAEEKQALAAGNK
ncbi:MAG: hypothetical protein RIE56_12005 [Amphiplicatus sp.]